MMLNVCDENIWKENFMKKKKWLILYNLMVSALFLLSLYGYIKRLTALSLILALIVFGEIGVRAFIENKIIQGDSKIIKVWIYNITYALKFLCEISLIIGVWYIRLN